MREHDPRLDALPTVQREVLLLRFFGDSPKTLAEVGEALGLSREEVRNYETEAFASLAGEPESD